jgi:hypothetical protein
MESSGITFPDRPVFAVAEQPQLRLRLRLLRAVVHLAFKIG